MDELAIKVAVLRAAIAHAKRNAKPSEDRRGLALFYVKCEMQQAQTKRYYWHRRVCASLLRDMMGAQLLTSLLETYVLALGKAEAAGLVPTTNRGLTVTRRCKVYPRTWSVDKVEDVV